MILNSKHNLLAARGTCLSLSELFGCKIKKEEEYDHALHSIL